MDFQAWRRRCAALAVYALAFAAVAADWRPDQAEAIQRAAAMQAAQRSSPTGRDSGDRLQQRLQRLTGFGAPGHVDAAVAEPRMRAARDRHALDLQLRARTLAAQRGLDPASALAPLRPSAAKAGAITLSLRTSAEGALGSGYVYAYSAAGNYLDASNIGADGSINLAVDAGETVELYVFPAAPFAVQVVEDLVVQPGAQVTLRQGVRVPVQVDSQEAPAYAGSLRVSLVFGTTTSLYRFTSEVAPDTHFGSEPAIYLAAGHEYRATPIVEAPWLGGTVGPFDSTLDALRFSLQRGHTLTLRLSDPLDLRAGCSLAGSLSVLSPRLLGTVQEIASAQPLYDDGYRLVGLRTAVPRERVVDLNGYFYGCDVQDWAQRNVVFRGDVEQVLALSPRPRPQISLQTPEGAPLAWTSGWLYPTDAADEASYVAPNYTPTNLVAGRRYDLVLTPADADVGIASTRLTASAGSFPVEVVAPSLRTLTTRLLVDDGVYLNGVLEFRRQGQLVAAFEVGSGRTHALKLPAGDYQMTASGLAGHDFGGGQAFALLLRPFTQAVTVTEASGQTLDLAITRPTRGIRFDLGTLGASLHATALESGRPVAAIQVYAWLQGLRSDYETLSLRLRGPGFDDVATSVATSAAFPTVDLLARGNGDHRIRGTLRRSNGVALADSPILLFAEDGLYADYFQTDALGRFDLPAVRNSLIQFLAPDDGSDLMQTRRIGDPAQAAGGDVQLASSSFLPVSAAGPSLQRLYGDGSAGYRILFIAEGYTAAHEGFTDGNGNGVWDGLLFLDLNQDQLWQQDEPVTAYGERDYPGEAQAGTDIRAGNEAFVDDNGDGYPSIDDYAVFAQNARNYLRALLATPEIASGIDFDAYLLYLPSAQAGMDVIAADGSTRLLDRDTRFGASFELQRYLLGIDYDAVTLAANAALPDWDLHVVMINQPVQAGRANSFILANGGIGASSPNNAVAGHEFGHNPGGLADEYDEFGGTATAWLSPSLRHLTHVPDDLASPWLALLPARLDAPVSTPQTPGLGFYAGGLYQAGGVYRASSNSRMRYNAPDYNAPSRLRLQEGFCHAQLDEADLLAHLPPPSEPTPSVLFASGFEDDARWVTLDDPCR